MTTPTDPAASTALVLIAPGAIAAVADDQIAKSIPSLIAESVEDIFQLPRVTVPAGGVTSFVVKDLAGERTVEEIVGVIALRQSRQRAYYSKPYGIGDPGPPECSSTNGVDGFGLRGIAGDDHEPAKHDCIRCPWNEYGSKAKVGRPGLGRVCQEFMRLFVFGDEDYVPVTISVPPSSLKIVGSYSIEVARKGMRLHHVKTSIRLVRGPSGGFTVAKLDLRSVGKLSPDEARRFDAIHDGLEESLAPHMSAMIRSERTPRDVEPEPADELDREREPGDDDDAGEAL